DIGGCCDGFGLIAFALQKQAQRFENVGLIIGDKSARSGWNNCLHRYCLRGVIAKPRAIGCVSISAQMICVRRRWKSGEPAIVSTCGNAISHKQRTLSKQVERIIDLSDRRNLAAA